MPISDKRAADLLCSAFEGGSNYWYNIVGYKEPTSTGQPWGAEYTPRYIGIPFSVDGAVLIQDIEDEEGDVYTLNHAAVQKGKKLLSTDDRYKHHYADLLAEQDDAETGDVFLQLCLFGEVVYG